jgi:hypothetical protein
MEVDVVLPKTIDYSEELRTQYSRAITAASAITAGIDEQTRLLEFLDICDEKFISPGNRLKIIFPSFVP